jgi:Xaa-Pro aminopeptidase
VNVITTEVEAPRLRAEGPFAELGWPVSAVPWYDVDAFVRRAEHELDAPAATLAGDGHPAFGTDASRELGIARMVLTSPDVEAMRALGHDAAAVVEDALAKWRPGEADRAIAARIVAGAEGVGALAPVVLVGGDQRLRQFRHPVATGAPIDDIAMAVLVASRGGLHVALTRYAGRRAAASALASGLDAVRDIHVRVLRACAPGVKVGAVLDELAAAYADHGQAGAWEQHYQGGPIGYAQREFEIAPPQRDDPWWEHVLEPNTAVAWNPSLPGGAKDEDTYLLGDGEPELLTTTGNWPTVEHDGLTRPSVLLVDN